MALDPEKVAASGGLKEPPIAERTMTFAEVQKLVEKVAADVAAQAEARFQALLEESPRAPGGGDDEMMSRLAMAIAKLTTQGTGQTYVAPEILARREVAQKRMNDAIARYREAGVMPQYKLTQTVYLDFTLISPTYIDRDHVHRPQEIGWPAAPNLAMRPLNDAAKEIYAAFLESIGETAPNDDFVRPVSPMGLVVKNASKPHPVQAATGVGGGVAPSMVQIVGRNQVPVVHKHILGHIVPPAQQQV